MSRVIYLNCLYHGLRVTPHQCDYQQSCWTPKWDEQGWFMSKYFANWFPSWNFWVEKNSLPSELHNVRLSYVFHSLEPKLELDVYVVHFNAPGLSVAAIYCGRTASERSLKCPKAKEERKWGNTYQGCSSGPHKKDKAFYFQLQSNYVQLDPRMAARRR